MWGVFRGSHKYVEKGFAAGGSAVTNIKLAFSNLSGKLIFGLAGAAVVVLSAVSLLTSPVLGSMDLDLRHGALALEATPLEATHIKLATFDDLHEEIGATYIGDGLSANVAQDSISFIGDSVSVFPGSIIAEETGAIVDAEVGRSLESGVPLILSMQVNGTLGKDVVVALATNAHPVSFDAAKELCENIAPGHRIIFVTAHGVGHGEMSELNDKLRTLADDYDFVSIADWDKAIADHEEWLAADGYHCEDQQSISLYAQTVIAALDASKKNPTS